MTVHPYDPAEDPDVPDQQDPEVEPGTEPPKPTETEPPAEDPVGFDAARIAT